MATKRKFVGILVVLVIIAAAATALLTMSGGDKSTKTLDLYFLNESATSIRAEKREIKYEFDQELPDKVIDLLRHGPNDGKNLRIMGRNVKWSITADKTSLLVDFSQNFLTTDATKNLLATYAVVKSLCQIDGVSQVKVTVEGGEIIAPDNRRIDYLSDKDINLESDSHTSENRTVKLYFEEKESGKLKAEYRTVKVTDTMPMEQYVVAELIKGPMGGMFNAVLSADTQILSAQTTDGTAYINMSQSFIDKNTGSKEKEELAVYSIVNSVCALSDINSVQFLIDGKKSAGFQNVDLGGILYKRMELTDEAK